MIEIQYLAAATFIHSNILGLNYANNFNLDVHLMTLDGYS